MAWKDLSLEERHNLLMQELNAPAPFVIDTDEGNPIVDKPIINTPTIEKPYANIYDNGGILDEYNQVMAELKKQQWIANAINTLKQQEYIDNIKQQAWVSQAMKTLNKYDEGGDSQEGSDRRAKYIYRDENGHYYTGTPENREAILFDEEGNIHSSSGEYGILRLPELVVRPQLSHPYPDTYTGLSVDDLKEDFSTLAMRLAWIGGHPAGENPGNIQGVAQRSYLVDRGLQEKIMNREGWFKVPAKEDHSEYGLTKNEVMQKFNGTIPVYEKYKSSVDPSNLLLLASVPLLLDPLQKGVEREDPYILEHPGNFSQGVYIDKTTGNIYVNEFDLNDYSGKQGLGSKYTNIQLKAAEWLDRIGNPVVMSSGYLPILKIKDPDNFNNYYLENKPQLFNNADTLNLSDVISIDKNHIRWNEYQDYKKNIIKDNITEAIKAYLLNKSIKELANQNTKNMYIDKDRFNTLNSILLNTANK